MTHEVLLGDCLELLPSLASGSVDAVICDPPYPCIKRSYGYWTEAEWVAMMDRVVPECRRILKPTGSAVFILQPNSERVGRMRTWLWDFMAKWGREWGIVQDAWWWNDCAFPEAHAIQGKLMRPSVKACIWLGSHDCHRNQDDVLIHIEKSNAKRLKAAERYGERVSYPSGQGMSAKRGLSAALRRGGATPFNVLPFGNGSTQELVARAGQPAGTPLALCRWWTRYICPPGGILCDPFAGSGTTGVAAVVEGRNYIGLEKMPDYVTIARKRIAEAQAELPLFAEGTA